MRQRTRRNPEGADALEGVTIHDVAREAKVSIATVSRALNGESSVRGATRERIQEAAKRLHYLPHGGARSLITRKTRTIGVLLPDIYGEFFSEVIRGLDLVARQHHYSLLVACTHGESQSAGAMLKALHGRVDGLVVLSSQAEMPGTFRELHRRTPVVFLNPVPESEPLDSISVDNYGGALAMTRYLVGLGHRRVVFVKGPDGNADAQDRLRGFRDAVASSPGRIEATEVPGDFSEAGGFRAGSLALEHAPTAIFAANDAMAIGVLCALRERGIRVPTDISLAGFDDVPIVRYLTPPLSSIRAPISDLGAGAAERLLQRIDAGASLAPRHHTLEVLLVARSSTGPPSSGEAALATPDTGKPASRAPPGSAPSSSKRTPTPKRRK